VTTLSGVVAHELNNIAVALGGFLDLGTAEGAPLDLVLQSLDEARIGLERVSRLSADLQSLADADSKPVPITIGECMLASAQSSSNFSNRIVWACDRSERIQADPVHARRAVDAQVRLARSPLEFAKRVQIPAGSACSGCGRKLSHPGGFFAVKARGLRLPGNLTARDPLDPSVKSSVVRRLTFTVMVYSVHTAGGHLDLEPAEDTVTLLFPIV
jgi:hypothetical protein